MLLDSTVTITTSDLIPVYIALGGTLFSALLAAIVSFRASSKASATAHRVAELTIKTNLQVADIASRTAKELKVVDYRNESNKMVLSKRLAAWEVAMDLATSMAGILKASTRLEDRPTEEIRSASFYSYFNNADGFNGILKKITATTPTAFWLGPEYGHHLQTVYQRLAEIKSECVDALKSKESGYAVIDEKHLLNAGIKYFAECEKIIQKSHRLLMIQVKVMHDVDSFLAKLSS